MTLRFREVCDLPEILQLVCSISGTLTLYLGKFPNPYMFFHICQMPHIPSYSFLSCHLEEPEEKGMQDQNTELGEREGEAVLERCTTPSWCGRRLTTLPLPAKPGEHRKGRCLTRKTQPVCLRPSLQRTRTFSKEIRRTQEELTLRTTSYS